MPSKLKCTSNILRNKYSNQKENQNPELQLLNICHHVMLTQTIGSILAIPQSSIAYLRKLRNKYALKEKQAITLICKNGLQTMLCS